MNSTTAAANPVWYIEATVSESFNHGHNAPFSPGSAAAGNTMETATQQTVDDLDILQSGPASTSGRSDAELLKSALTNEKAAPEILQFETDLIGRIESNMDYQVITRDSGAYVGQSGHSKQASLGDACAVLLPRRPAGGANRAAEGGG